MKLVAISVLLAFSFMSCDSAKILGVFPYPSYSHTILGQALFTELAKRGHEVTFLSPYPLKVPPHKNYRDIAITSPELFNAFQEELDLYFDEPDTNMIMLLKLWFDNTARMVELTMSDDAVQKLLNSDEQFDVCVIEFLMNESLLGFAAHYGCKVIAMSTIGQIKYINDMVHSPMPLSTVPHPFLSLTDHMSFLQRFENIFATALEDFGCFIYHYPLQEAIYEKYFKSESRKIPPFRHMLRHSVSLVLLNTHYSLNYPQAYLPNMIEIGGFHVKNETNPLPDDIKTFIESAEHGVVYFSLGGNLKPSKMSDDKKQAIYSALAKLKEKVIWKWDEELSVDDNKFMVRKWLPQDDILAHRNVKLFITHGGLLSCTESILRGKPVVGIPIFGDQMMNMARAELLGWGVQVSFTNLTELSLSWAMHEVLSNEKYKRNVLKIASRLLDQPQTPMEKAMFYIDYVIRHDGATFMQTSAAHLSFFEYHNLDVYATLSIIAFLIIFIPVLVLKRTFELFTSSKKPSHLKKLN